MQSGSTTGFPRTSLKSIFRATFLADCGSVVCGGHCARPDGHHHLQLRRCTGQRRQSVVRHARAGHQRQPLRHHLQRRKDCRHSLQRHYDSGSHKDHLQLHRHCNRWRLSHRRPHARHRRQFLRHHAAGRSPSDGHGVQGHAQRHHHDPAQLQSFVDGAFPWGPPILASDGNFYGTTSGGGINGNGIVYKMTTSGTVNKGLPV